MPTQKDSAQAPEFHRALALFVRSPQTRLVRHLWRRMQEDPLYAAANRTSVERVITDILHLQGLDANRVFAWGGVFRLIGEAARKLEKKTRSKWENRIITSAEG